MTTPDPALYEAVRASRLAEELSPEQTAVLAGLLSLETFEAQQVLAREGTADNRLYVIVEGSLGIVKHMGTPDESLIVTLSAGDFAHELGFLDGAERYASLVAATKTRVLVLEREKLESLIDTHMDAAVYNLLAILCLQEEAAKARAAELADHNGQ